MPSPKKGMPTWVLVLLIVGVLVVVGGGILGSLAIYGVRKYLLAAKSAEALSSLTQIGIDATRVYEQGTPNARGEVIHRLCPSASVSVPASLASVKGTKYQSAPGEWEVDKDKNAGFACLHFSMSQPQYFVYRYRAHGSSKPDDSFDAEADGDLSGDGNLTTFRAAGKISASHTLEVTPAPPLL